jgi:hypothetical protein
MQIGGWAGPRSLIHRTLRSGQAKGSVVERVVRRLRGRRSVVTKNNDWRLIPDLFGKQVAANHSEDPLFRPRLQELFD